jgi:hypothetical protein
VKREHSRGEDLSGGQEERRALEVRNLKRAASLRPGVNTWGAKKEDGLRDGSKPLKRRYKAGMVL